MTRQAANSRRSSRARLPDMFNPLKATRQPERTDVPPGKPREDQPEDPKALVTRKDGRVLLRKTVYVPPDLARSIAIYGAHLGTDTSGAIVAICGDFLATWRVP